MNSGKEILPLNKEISKHIVAKCKVKKIRLIELVKTLIVYSLKLPA